MSITTGIEIDPLDIKQGMEVIVQNKITRDRYYGSVIETDMYTVSVYNNDTGWQVFYFSHVDILQSMNPLLRTIDALVSL